MTNDSTELTFVRCPSCRSLVPAVSTRCRMCGSSLGGGAEDAAESEASEQSRVRKNTTSTESSAPVVDQVRQDVESAREALDSRRKLDQEEVEEPELENFDEDADDDSFEDPLGEFIEEVDFDDEDDDADDEYDDLLDDDSDDEDDFDPPVQEETPVKPLVRVESGGGKRAGGLSFGGDKGLKRKEEPASDQTEKKAKETEKSAAIEPSKPPHAQELNGHDHNSDLVADKEVAKEQESAPLKKQAAAPQPEAAKQPMKPKTQAPVQSGRLCGWLVSYASDSNGSATELREGKFFVSGSKLKESDLVIEDESVSTPHAIMNLDSKTFKIQDLMSDQGVYLKRKGSSDYSKEEESFVVAHGDWVRFGEVEYLVTLIAAVGE